MKISALRTDIPTWAVDGMMKVCTYCGSYIVDNSDTGVTTARWCSNPRCPGHMAHKMVELAKYFGVKGFGPKTAYARITREKLTSHFDIIPVMFPDTKPLVSLADIAVLCCIEGYGATTAEKELAAYPTFEMYFNEAYPVNPLLVRFKDVLIEAEKYFTIKPPLAKKQLLVMGTGSFNGYRNREQYFNDINTVFGQYVHVIQTGKRKTKVAFLIKEVGTRDRSKSQTAKEYNIPIVTPKEFITYLSTQYPYAINKE